MAPYLDWAYSQLFVNLPYPKRQYVDQTIIVTGSNVGLGREAARHFVRLNAAKVILAVRNLEKGETAKQSIEESEGRKDVVEVWELDLASYESVKRFARRAEGLERLDVLLENAGIYTENFSRAEGSESNVTVNVISTFLLAVLLLPKLRETAVTFYVVPRLVIVSSFVHYLTQFREGKAENILEELDNEAKANMVDRYNVTKLLEVFIVRELSRLITESPQKGSIVLNCVNPGWCRTEVMREWTGLRLMILRYASMICARTTEVGSRTLVHAAEEGGEDTHGKYLHDCQIARVSDLVTSDEGVLMQKKVWEEVARKLERIQPGILRNI